MLDVLARLEGELPSLLASPAAARWESVRIDYHPPFVDRIWFPWGEGFRVSLHRIDPCGPGEALFHPHPWPQAVRVLSGHYEMGLGFGAGEDPPPVAQRIVVRGEFVYEMTDPDGWHYVRPIEVPSVSVMITGKPWRRTAPKSTKPLRSLEAERRRSLLDEVRRFYEGGSGR